MTHVVVIGAGIIGVSTGLWLRRAGFDVTLIDKGTPGMGASYGNGCILASCSVVPVTGPGLVKNAPKMLRDLIFHCSYVGDICRNWCHGWYSIWGTQIPMIHAESVRD